MGPTLKTVRVYKHVDLQYIMPSEPGYLGRPKVQSKWLGTSTAQHEIYRAVLEI
jgi:hypothetical protein